MDAKTIFLIIWFITAVFILTTLYLKGKKALAIFPNIDGNTITFRDNRASGYSTKSLKTKLGGVRNALDIVVINDELWLKSMLLFAFICKRNDLLHKIPFKNIKNINKNGNEITIDFTSETADDKQLVITTKKPKELIDALKINPTVNPSLSETSKQNIFSGIAKRQKFLLIAILILFCGAIVFFQYKTQKEKHERLATTGQIVPITSKLTRSYGDNYSSYYFITGQGKKIEGYEKCGKEYYKYLTATAIYNPNDPTDYELSFNYKNYYPTWRIIFFFFIYLPVMVFVTYRFVHLGVIIYKTIKR